MHLRIYLWLSCVLLAGYVRATEETVADATATEAISGEVQSDQHASAPKDAYADDSDDDGSGLDPDESSGSGWGQGPGVDDEDGRGSGDAPITHELPEDDEDFAPRTTTLSALVLDYESPEPENTDRQDTVEVAQTPEPSTEAPILRSRQFDVDVPNAKNKASEEVEERPGAGAEQPSRPEQTDISISGEDLSPSSPDHDAAGSNVNTESRPADNVVFIMNAKAEDRATSFFAQPGILAAVIGGAVVGLLCAILVVMFIVYRMRKKDEGSYALDEPKRSPAAASYGKGHNNREFYA